MAAYSEAKRAEAQGLKAESGSGGFLGQRECGIYEQVTITVGFNLFQ